jgi:sugar/nucleoside kinase (ribokinase family)
MMITLLGTFILDTIFPFRGGKAESFGGIFFDIAWLSKLLGTNDKIYPLTFLGEDVAGPVINKLRQMPNVTSEGMVKLNQPNNRVTLAYFSENERNEFNLNPFPPLEFKHIQPYLKSEVMVINYFTGWELALGTLQEIRKNYSGLIYLDIHSLVMGYDPKDGKRFYRSFPQWKSYVACADIVQMNESEAEMLAEKELSTRRRLGEFAIEVTKQGPKVCSVTLGERGALVAFQGKSEMVAGVKPGMFVDPTGCGDAYGAAFLTSYLKTKNPLRAVRFANKIASLNCMVMGTRGIESMVIPDA